MEMRQSLLDWAMNKQTKSDKEYPLIQELLFNRGEGEGKDVSTGRTDSSKKTS